MERSSGHCPHCHRPTRAGIALSPLKAAIFDAIKAAGDVGISSREVMDAAYGDAKAPRAIDTVKSHVHQINDLLLATDTIIVSEGRGHRARWHVARRIVRFVA